MLCMLWCNIATKMIVMVMHEVLQYNGDSYDVIVLTSIVSQHNDILRANDIWAISHQTWRTWIMLCWEYFVTIYFSRIIFCGWEIGNCSLIRNVLFNSFWSGVRFCLSSNSCNSFLNNFNVLYLSKEGVSLLISPLLTLLNLLLQEHGWYVSLVLLLLDSVLTLIWRVSESIIGQAGTGMARWWLVTLGPGPGYPPPVTTLTHTT